MIRAVPRRSHALLRRLIAADKLGETDLAIARANDPNQEHYSNRRDEQPCQTKWPQLSF